MAHATPITMNFINNQIKRITVRFRFSQHSPNESDKFFISFPIFSCDFRPAFTSQSTKQHKDHIKYADHDLFTGHSNAMGRQQLSPQFAAGCRRRHHNGHEQIVGIVGIGRTRRQFLLVGRT